MLINTLNSKKTTYILMTALVFMWGMEYIAAKAALEAIEPLSLICVKYCVGLILLIILKTVTDRKFPVKRRDIPLLFACALFGDVFYFAAEYGAMSYLPVSLITVILAFVPCVSVVIEAFLYKKKPDGIIIAGVVASVAGVAMVIGVDVSELLQGRYIGYLLAFGAVICWNIYNFLTKGLAERYKAMDLTILQQICAVLLTLPFTLANLPQQEAITPQVVGGVLYLGSISAFIGFLIYVKAINVIGPTSCALFSNFMPVTTTLFGWMLLNEYVSTVQLLGGLVIIASGCVVIRQKGKEE